MQPFHLRAIERGGGAVVAARDFYAFQQGSSSAGRGGVTPARRVSGTVAADLRASLAALAAV